MGNLIDDTNLGRLVSDIKAKTDASYWPKDQTQEVELATVATTGSYNDLEDKPSGGVGSFAYVGTCPTAAATATKVVTTQTFPTSNGAPLVGTIIAVKFDITNTASAPKLNVNGLGAASIYYNTGVVTSTSGIYGGTKDRYVYYMWDGTNWVWLNQGTEANDNTLAYNIRTAGQRLTVATACYRYRLLFTSADGTKWVPANSSSSTNATASRTPATAKINPFGQITYYSYTTALSSGGQPSASYQYQQYNGVTIGYSFNNTGAAATMTTMAPIYIKCTPQTDGSAIIDATTPYVQALPSTNDGKIYIFLGIATSATAFELMLNHPVYYHDGTGIRLWTGKAGGGSSDAVLYTQQSLTDAQKAQARTNIGATVPEVFWATYGTTTVAEIEEAISEGKIIIVIYEVSTFNQRYAIFTGKVAQTYIFNAVNGTSCLYLELGSNGWSENTYGFEYKGNQVNTIFIDSAYEAVRYTSVKAVYDAVFPAKETSMPSGGFLPNKPYVLGTISGNNTFSLASASDSNIINHYYWTFETGSTAPSITWPAGLSWTGGSAPTIKANMHYEISVIDNMAAVMEV